jgi:hypothetical protein
MTRANSNRIDLIGQSFNRFSVIEEVKKPSHIKKPSRYWLCKCACGTEKIVEMYNLTSGHSKSCGCLKNEKCGNSFRSHGKRWTPEYKSWYGMKDRCNNPKSNPYKDYGGRGIEVCNKWLNSFEKFYEDMGQKPSPRHSIDRIDNEGNYTKGNCKWSTPKEQANNRRSNRDYIR